MTRLFLATLLVILTSCSVQPKYKIGECFFWRYNPDFYGRVVDVDVKKKTYLYQNVKGAHVYMRIMSIDRNTDKIKCEKTSL